MKKFLITVMIALGGLAIALPDAEARRLGGGGSFGKRSQMTRQAPAQQSPTQATSANQSKAATAPGARTSPWRNILGGALLGLGLGALLSHFGIGGALASMISTILMIALLAFAVMFIIRMFRRKGPDANARYAYAGGNGSVHTPEIGSRREPYAQPAAFQADTVQAGTTQASSIPADFDVPGFLRNAKTYFIRLQAAWDRADVNDIREFTSPEMFAELRMQLNERGASANHTDVVSLEAELLGVETIGDEYLAGVRFSGMIKEAEKAPAEPFTEIWNLAKPVSGQGGWTLAGIQQES